MRLKRITLGVLKILPFLCLLVLMAGNARATLTLEDEKKLGKEIYEKIEQHNLILREPRVDAFIDQVGRRVLAQSRKSPFEFRFTVINSSGINAFATPGGYIYINRGLIYICEDESELAGVIAHELAHSNARHIADAIEKSKKTNLATAAAILAAAVLGGGSPEAMAMMTFSLATAATMSLKYSRENEEEADRLGMNYLAGAGYDPQSMLEFLKIMRRHDFYSNNIPSYFLTHPGTDERVRYLDSLTQTTYTKSGAKSIIGGFRKIQTILRLEDKNTEASLKYFQEEASKHPGDAESLYGLAVMQSRKGNTAEALRNFSRALQLAPDDPDVLRGLGISYFNAGKPGEAVAPLERAYRENDGDPETILYLGRAYEQTGNYRAAVEVLQRAVEKNPGDGSLYYPLATSYGYLDQQGESHYNFGMYYMKKRKNDSALFHFRQAQRFYPAGSPRELEISRHIETLSRKDAPKVSAPPEGTPRGRRGSARFASPGGAPF